MTSAANNHALGVLAWMAMIGDTHNRLTVIEFLNKLGTDLANGHLQVLQRQGKPVAWLIWRLPAKETWMDLVALYGDDQTDVQLLEGQVWLDFWVRPFGCDVQLANMVGQCIRAHGIADLKLCWHDPGTAGGRGQLHLSVPIEQLHGL